MVLYQLLKEAPLLNLPFDTDGIITLVSQNDEPETFAVQKMDGVTPSMGCNSVW